MQIQFEKLITVAPFSENVRKDILSKTLTDDQKYKLTELAWQMIALSFQAKLKYQTDLISLEITQGKRKYNKNDFVEAQVALYHELADKFEVVEKEQGISQIKEELDKYINPIQFTQDKKSSEAVQFKQDKAPEYDQTTERPQDVMKKPQ